MLVWGPQMDPQCDGAQVSEACDPTGELRPTPAKLARLELNGIAPPTLGRSRQGSPGVKSPVSAPKPTTLGPQHTSCHKRGTAAEKGGGTLGAQKGDQYLEGIRTLQYALTDYALLGFVV